MGLEQAGKGQHLSLIHIFLQAAGRVIRTEEDMGVVLLLDDRFGSPEYTRLFPLEWGNVQGCRLGNAGEQIENFWKMR